MRLLALALALNAGFGAAIAAGQTVIVQHAPAGSGLEVLFNTASQGSATADAEGDATVTMKAFPARGAETSARVSVEVCDALRRVLLTEPGATPAALTPGCGRRDAPEVYVVRRETTFVVDVTPPDFRVRIRQGPAPREWLRHGPVPVRVWRPALTGLVLMGAGGLFQFGDAASTFCGDVTTCSTAGRGAVAAGLEYGFSRLISAQASFLMPSVITVSGSGDGFRFDTTVETRLVTFAGKIGGQVGPLKLYGLGGGTYHRVLSTTSNTADDTTLVINGVTQTAPGGTTRLVLRAGGWGWLLGGGVESWVAPRTAIFGEFTMADLTGTNIDGGEGTIGGYGTSIVVGARVHVWRSEK